MMQQLFNFLFFVPKVLTFVPVDDILYDKGGRTMKKKNIINLIKYYSEDNDSAFKNEAYEIARDFDQNGDPQLAEYIMALMSSANTFVPQINEDNLNYFEKVIINNDALPLPESIEHDVLGVINAINRNLGINKFLFQGPAGTGKTETAKQIARILGRDLFMINFSTIIDSKLGQTTKNIVEMFQEINSYSYPSKVIFLFDEIDSIAMDRTNSNDLREMGRATSTILRELDRLNEQIVVIATTNLFDYFDKALVRRFDAIIDFSRYSQEDLLEISESIINVLLSKFKSCGHNVRLFRKIIKLMEPIPMPGELKNLLKTSVAFSDPSDEYDYLKRLYFSATGTKATDIKELQGQGFTLREIEVLTGVSKSQVSRNLKGGQE